MLTVRILENDPLVERKVIRAKAQEKTDNVDDVSNKVICLLDSYVND